MRRGRFLFGAALLLSALTLLGGAPAALAATPQDICNDLKDGKVDGSYTADEWTAFFSDPTVQGYGCGTVPPPPSPTITPVVPLTPTPENTLTPPTPVLTPVQQVAPAVQLPAVSGVAGTQKTVKGKPQVLGAKSPTKSAAAPLTATRTRGTLPFTGAELALFALVGIALIASGLLLRTTARHKSQS
jgi:hypothetical protein